MGKLIGSEVEELRPFEPDYPRQRNPWDAKHHPKQFAYIDSIIKHVDAENSRPPKYSNEVKLAVYRLRDAGFTLREIASEVKISKSTACLYLQNRKTAPVQVTTVVQPGTTKTVETSYSLNEVNIGNLSPKSDIQ